MSIKVGELAELQAKLQQSVFELGTIIKHMRESELEELPASGGDAMLHSLVEQVQHAVRMVASTRLKGRQDENE